MCDLRDDFDEQFAAVKEHHHAEHVGWDFPIGDSYYYVEVLVTVEGRKHAFRGIDFMHGDNSNVKGWLLHFQSAFDAALAAPPLS